MVSEIAVPLLGERPGSLPDDPRVLQHVDPVGVRQREGDVLLASNTVIGVVCRSFSSAFDNCSR